MSWCASMPLVPFPTRKTRSSLVAVLACVLASCANDDAPPGRSSTSSPVSPRSPERPLASFFPLSLGDRWRTVDAPGGTIAEHGVTAIDARGQAVVHGTDRAVIELFRPSPTAIERVSPTGTSLGVVLAAPAASGTTFAYEGGEGENRPRCEGRIVRDDAAFDLDGLPLAGCLVVERTCTHAATPPLPPGTRELHEETYCPGVGLVRDALRFAPELPAGSPIGPRVTTVSGFRTRGGPAPRGGPLDCDDAIVLPTDVLAACGGGPYRAVELAADRSGEDCVHAFVGPGSASPIRTRIRRLDHEAGADDVAALAGTATGSVRQALAEGNVAVLLESDPDGCSPERLGRLVPLLRSVVR